MQHAYKRLSDSDPRAPAFARVLYPHGNDFDGVCLRNGWQREVPGPEHTIYDEKGVCIQEAQEPAPAKAHHKVTRAAAIEEADSDA